MKKLFAVLVAFFASIPFVAAATTHTVQGDLSGLTSGLIDLVRGNVSSFVDGLVGALPLIGLFLVVYGLVFFLAEITIFKDASDNHKKYSNLFALGIALLGLAQQGVYNIILSWSALFLQVAFIVALVFMFLIFLNHSKKIHYETGTAMYTAKKAYLPEKAEAKKLEHDLKMEKKTYDHVDDELSTLNHELSSITKLAGNERAQVEKIISLLSRASASAKIGTDEAETQRYAKTLATGIHSLISTMKHEPSHFKKFEALMHDVEYELASWGKTSSSDIHDITTDMNLLKHHNKKHHGGSHSDADLALIKDDVIIKGHLRDLSSYLHELDNIEKSLVDKKDRMLHHSLHEKYVLAEDARKEIYSGNYDSAEGHLKKLHSDLQSEEMLLEQIREDEHTVKSALTNIKHIEDQLKSINLDEKIRLAKGSSSKV